MVNKNKRLHSVKVECYFESDWSITNQTIIFKTIEEMEKWEMNNPQLPITKIKMRYYKKGKSLNDIPVAKLKCGKYPMEVINRGAGECGNHTEIISFPRKTSDTTIKRWLTDRGWESEYYGSSYAGSLYEMVVIKRKNKVYAIQKYDV